MQELAEARLTAWVHGCVQGVGFRWWTRSRALELGLTGYASNRPDEPQTPSNPWRTLSARPVYENPWIRVREDVIERDDGSVGL